jgi:transposase-like protein
MTKGDVICPECGAGFRRIELASQRGKKGEYRCPACDTLLERLTDEKLVAYRLTIQPSLKALID